MNSRFRSLKDKQIMESHANSIKFYTYNYNQLHNDSYNGFKPLKNSKFFGGIIIPCLRNGEKEQPSTCSVSGWN